MSPENLHDFQPSPREHTLAVIMANLCTVRNTNNLEGVYVDAVRILGHVMKREAEFRRGSLPGARTAQEAAPWR